MENHQSVPILYFYQVNNFAFLGAIRNIVELTAYKYGSVFLSFDLQENIYKNLRRNRHVFISYVFIIIIRAARKTMNNGLQQTWFGLFGFYGISTFVVYSMPDPFLYK